MALEGNGNNLLGKRASFDGLGIDFTHWREYAIHWVHDVDHKFSYGARLKYLYGMENFSTDVSYMGLTTDQNTHALTFDMNFDLRSSGLPLAMIDNTSLGRKKALGGIDIDEDDMMAQAGFSSGNINNNMFNTRNTGLGIKDYTTIFKKILGLRKIIWLEKGISGDDTHGHIDDVARFVSKNKVFLAVENNKKDKNFKNLKKNLDILNKTIIDNKKLKIIKIPMPSPKIIERTRVPATYLNFYIANKIVLVPVFNDAKDKIVINIFKKNFKSRKIIPINCSELIWGFGAIHCMTQQEPI